MQILLVFIGGGLGSVCRFAISAFAVRYYPSTFPWGTLWANLLACLILGVLVGLSVRNLLPPPYRFLLMSGFCGGFSTFSTFSNETLGLLQSGQYAQAAANVLLSLLIGLISLYLGMRIALYAN
jgi:CrcB protein